MALWTSFPPCISHDLSCYPSEFSINTLSGLMEREEHTDITMQLLGLLTRENMILLLRNVLSDLHNCRDAPGRPKGARPLALCTPRTANRRESLAQQDREILMQYMNARHEQLEALKELVHRWASVKAEGERAARECDRLRTDLSASQAVLARTLGALETLADVPDARRALARVLAALGQAKPPVEWTRPDVDASGGGSASGDDEGGMGTKYSEGTAGATHAAPVSSEELQPKPEQLADDPAEAADQRGMDGGRGQSPPQETASQIEVEAGWSSAAVELSSVASTATATATGSGCPSEARCSDSQSGNLDADADADADGDGGPYVDLEATADGLEWAAVTTSISADRLDTDQVQEQLQAARAVLSFVQPRRDDGAAEDDGLARIDSHAQLIQALAATVHVAEHMERELALLTKGAALDQTDRPVQVAAGSADIPASPSDGAAAWTLDRHRAPAPQRSVEAMDGAAWERLVKTKNRLQREVVALRRERDDLASRADKDHARVGELSDVLAREREKSLRLARKVQLLSKRTADAPDPGPVRDADAMPRSEWRKLHAVSELRQACEQLEREKQAAEHNLRHADVRIRELEKLLAQRAGFKETWKALSQSPSAAQWVGDECEAAVRGRYASVEERLATVSRSLRIDMSPRSTWGGDMRGALSPDSRSVKSVTASPSPSTGGLRDRDIRLLDDDLRLSLSPAGGAGGGGMTKRRSLRLSRDDLELKLAETERRIRDIELFAIAAPLRGAGECADVIDASHIRSVRTKLLIADKDVRHVLALLEELVTQTAGLDSHTAESSPSASSVSGSASSTRASLTSFTLSAADTRDSSSETPVTLTPSRVASETLIGMAEPRQQVAGPPSLLHRSPPSPRAGADDGASSLKSIPISIPVPSGSPSASGVSSSPFALPFMSLFARKGAASLSTGTKVNVAEPAHPHLRPEGGCVPEQPQFGVSANKHTALTESAAEVVRTGGVAGDGAAAVIGPKAA